MARNGILFESWNTLCCICRLIATGGTGLSSEPPHDVTVLFVAREARHVSYGVITSYVAINIHNLESSPFSNFLPQQTKLPSKSICETFNYL